MLLWFHNIFKYAFIVIILFIAYIAIFLSSYGIQPWDKFSATGGSLLLSIISMYFGYKIERQRHRRENVVSEFLNFIRDIEKLMEQVNRIPFLISQNSNNKETGRVWREIQLKNKTLLDNLPPLGDISDITIRNVLEEHWIDIKALLEVLNQAAIENINTNEIAGIYSDMERKLSLFKQMLINYEQAQ